MINPKIMEEYGENGVKVLYDMLGYFTDEEKDSVYAVGHHCTSNICGMPHHIECDNPNLVDSIWDKIIEFVISLNDGESNMVCLRHRGEDGIKIWLTT